MNRGIHATVWLALALFGVINSPAASPDPIVITAQQQRIAVVEALSPSVVCIYGRDAGGGGTGVLISADGYALTNFHVTAGAGDFMRCGLNDGKLYDAIIVGIDPTGDVALIKLLGRDDFPHATLGDSDAVSVGNWVYVVGNPFLLASDFRPTVTYGIVSGTHRYQYPASTFLEYTDCIQFDTSLNPGNSGGPLFNEQGEVVGINGRGSFEKRGRVNVGAGYAISINQVKHFLDHLRSGRIVDHGTIEAMVVTRDDGTVRIATILEDSDAYRLGLRSGDEIVRFAGRPIRSANQFQNVLGIYPRGWTLPLTYRRESQTHDILVPLRPAHLESELLQFSQSQPDAENPQPGQDEPDDSKEDDAPKIPLPQIKEAAPAEEIPDDLKQQVETRVGFANYRFNELHQRRVLDALARDISLTSPSPGIVLLGTNNGNPARITLADKAVAFQVGNTSFLQPLADANEWIDEPAGSGGLLATFALWEKLLAGRQQEFAEFHYHGSEPLDGTGPRVDVLIAEDQGGRLRCLVDQESGRCVGLDFRRTDRSSRLRLRFSEERVTTDLGVLPKSWKGFVDDREVLQFELEEIRKLSAPQNDA